jgi:hypothetical protein
MTNEIIINFNLMIITIFVGAGLFFCYWLTEKIVEGLQNEK